MDGGMRQSPPPAPAFSFPTDVQEFDGDDRISFSRADNKFIAVQDDGTEFEFDKQLKRWIPALDEDEASAIQQQQLAYGGGGEYNNDNDGPERNSKRRRRGDDDDDDHQEGGGGGGGGGAEKPRRRPAKKPKAPPQPRQNTAIYVTGLPLDVTVDEVHDVFARKCGVVAEEIDSGRPRIKLYTDAATGQFKGDALVVFFKPQSVEMAIMLLDDTDFRYTSSGLASGRMRVQAADSSYKKTSYEQQEKNNNKQMGEQGQGQQQQQGREMDAGGPTIIGKPKVDRAREQDKQKVIKRTQKLTARLADWDDDGDDGPYAADLGRTKANNQRPRVVVLTQMFTLQELDEDPAALLEIKEDIRDECAKLGDVTNVVLYDLEPDGVASVRFREAEAAEKCVERMDGRAFDGRVVRAKLAEGSVKKLGYRKSDGGGAGGGEGDEDSD